jgi:beta-lactam-binding protein with PASTA domain
MSSVVEIWAHVSHVLMYLWPWRRVPAFNGKTLAECRLVAEDVNLDLQVDPDASPRAVVSAQDPEPGARVKRGSQILIVVESRSKFE